MPRNDVRATRPRSGRALRGRPIRDALRRRSRDLFFALTIAFSSLPHSAGAQIYADLFVSDARIPVSIAFTPDGRMLYTEKTTGRVRVVRDGALLPDPFLTVAVDSLWERGLLGICVDPDFGSNGYVYIDYVTAGTDINRVERWTDAGGHGADPLVLLEAPDDTPESAYHHGGNLHFGPDGMLYVTFGDGGSYAYNSQNLSNPFGKIHRIRPDGTIPPDNPFYDDGDPGTGDDDRIFAYGMRNSFDFAFHPVTGEILASENGPDVNDEINLVTAGGNYGWPWVTGFAGDPRFVDPLAAYTPTISPTGIVVCPGGAIPNFRNEILFADYNHGEVHLLHLRRPGYDAVTSETIVADLPGLNGAAVGPDGAVYLTGWDAIYRLSCRADTASAVADLRGDATGRAVGAVAEGDTLATFTFETEALDSVRVRRIRHAEPAGWTEDAPYIARSWRVEPWPPGAAYRGGFTVAYTAEEVALAGILDESRLTAARLDGETWRGRAAAADTAAKRVTIQPADGIEGLWTISTLDAFPTGVGHRPDAPAPHPFSLAQNRPNPFNPATTIDFALPEGPAVRVRLAIYDVRGRRVRDLLDGVRAGGGRYAVPWDGRDDRGRPLPSGAYLYRLSAGRTSAVRRMMLLR